MTVKLFSKIAISLLFVAAGLNHFINPLLYIHIMPLWLPEPVLLLYISGFFEILGGAMLWNKRFQAWSAWGLIALLIAVFPANIHMAMHPELTPHIPQWLLWVRLPLQIPLILWAATFTHLSTHSKYSNSV